MTPITVFFISDQSPVVSADRPGPAAVPCDERAGSAVVLLPKVYHTGRRQINRQAQRRRGWNGWVERGDRLIVPGERGGTGGQAFRSDAAPRFVDNFNRETDSACPFQALGAVSNLVVSRQHKQKPYAGALFVYLGRRLAPCGSLVFTST